MNGYYCILYRPFHAHFTLQVVITDKEEEAHNEPVGLLTQSVYDQQQPLQVCLVGKPISITGHALQYNYV